MQYINVFTWLACELTCKLLASRNLSNRHIHFSHSWGFEKLNGSGGWIVKVALGGMLALILLAQHHRLSIYCFVYLIIFALLCRLSIITLLLTPCRVIKQKWAGPFNVLTHFLKPLFSLSPSVIPWSHDSAQPLSLKKPHHKHIIITPQSVSSCSTMYFSLRTCVAWECHGLLVIATVKKGGGSLWRVDCVFSSIYTLYVLLFFTYYFFRQNHQFHSF